MQFHEKKIKGYFFKKSERALELNRLVCIKITQKKKKK